MKSKRIRAFLPWVIATGVLGYLLATVPFAELRGWLSLVAWWQLLVVTATYVALVFMIDGLSLFLAFRFALPDTKISYQDTLTLRGASYLLAIVNYGAGQGGIIYLLRERYGVPLARGSGAIILASAAFLGVVACAVGLGILASEDPTDGVLSVIAIIVFASIPLYLAVLLWRPKWLTRWSLLSPLFDAGITGNLAIGASRGLHIAVLILGHTTVMHLYGIEVPLATAAAGLPIVFLVASLPISPSGLGTAQAAAIALFASFAPSVGPDAQKAAVLAYSLSFHFVGLFLLLAVSLFCLRRLQRLPLK